ncbi:MAG: hypothetical protein R3F62_24565 [Planctomycetota bacterium]
MSDAELRTLQERYLSSGAVEDGVAWLHARVRAGDLSRERVALAAHLRDPVSAETLRSLGGPALGRFTTDGDWHFLQQWAFALEAYGDEVLLRVHVADAGVWLDSVAEAVRAIAQEGGDPADLRALGRVLQQVVEALQATVLDPERGRERLGRALALLDDRPRVLILRYDGWVPEPHAPRLRGALSCLGGTCQIARRLLSAGKVDPPGILWGTLNGIEPSPRPALLARLREELVPWAQGLSDPIAARQARLLETVNVASPCSAAWEAMRGDARTRFCDACAFEVHDLSGLTADEALALVRTRVGRACLRLYRRADGTVLTQDCAEGLRTRARRLALYSRLPEDRLMGMVAG